MGAIMCPCPLISQSLVTFVAGQLVTHTFCWITMNTFNVVMLSADSIITKG